MRITLAFIAMTGIASADALDDEIAREVCGSTPNGGLSVPNCSLSTAAKVAFAQTGDDEAPPLLRRSEIKRPTASADPDPVAKPDVEPLPHWRSALGLQLGSMTINGEPLDYLIGITAATGIQLDRLTVRGEYTLSGVHYSGPLISDARGDGNALSDTPGTMQRLGVAGRYAFAKGDTGSYVDEPQAIGELFVEAGAGWEHIAWDKGGVYQRPDVMVGLGMTGALRGEHSRPGMSFAFRMYIGRRPDLDGAAPTCSAPCTEATPPTAWSDRSYMFETEYSFGK